MKGSGQKTLDLKEPFMAFFLWILLNCHYEVPRESLQNDSLL